jgi:hypothetical protein
MKIGEILFKLNNNQSINQSSDTNDTDENTTAKKYIYVWKQ